MRNFKKVDSFNKRYALELMSAIDRIKPTLIEAFIRIYGEAHRDYIKYTIDNLLYVFFIPHDYFERLSNSSYVRKHDKYIMNYYLNYLKSLDKRKNNLNGEEIDAFVCQNYVADSSFYLEDLVAFNGLEIIQIDKPSFNVRKADCKEGEVRLKIVSLPILTTTLWEIIHEINHALCIDPIAESHDFLVLSNLFYVEEAEEVTCDFVTRMVLQEFKRLGGVIPKCLKRMPIKSEYINHDYIVSYLFQLLEPLILESLIGRRPNLFINLVGKKNYNRFNDLAQDLYRNGFNEYKYSELLDVVDRMYEALINTQFPNYEEYYKELKSMGARVRVLKSSA